MAARLRRTPGRRAASGGEGVRPARRFIGCVGLVGAGEVADGEDGREAGQEVGGGVELGRLEAEAVHAAVELQRAGAAGRARAAKSAICAALFRQGTRSWARKSVGVAGHQAGEDVDRRAGAERLAQRGAFLGERDEEAAGAGGGQRRRRRAAAPRP